MQRRGPRVNGPYFQKERANWKLHIFSDGGSDGTYETFATQEEAERRKAECEASFSAPQEVTLQSAVEQYEQYMRIKGNREVSLDRTLLALRRFFLPDERSLVGLTAKWCQGRYDELVKELAVDSHRNYLAESKTFLKWCCNRPHRWLGKSPLTDVHGVGRRRPGGKGKAQLTLDEAGLWLKVAFALADEGDDGAVAGLMTILMGLRASEIVTRTARDVDGGGAILRLDLREEECKTEGSAKPVKVPAMVRPYLIERKQGKLPGAFLFPSAPRGKKGRHDRDWPRDQVQRICGLAGVPKVHAHGMRGMRATLEVIASLQGGSGIEAAQRALRHESDTTTAQSYAADEAVAEARQAKVLQMLGRGER